MTDLNSPSEIQLLIDKWEIKLNSSTHQQTPKSILEIRNFVSKCSYLYLVKSFLNFIKSERMV